MLASIEEVAACKWYKWLYEDLVDCFRKLKVILDKRFEIMCSRMWSVIAFVGL